MKTELLAPAGSMDAFYQAIYNGANAIYLATSKFGARAYAKNFTLEELDKALDFAHALDIKIYVTVNTILKDNELDECFNYLDTLYMMGVDGIILTDLALVDYMLSNLKGMECHISTQSGIKDLNDIKFFEGINVNRCVLAREMSIDEIANIKSNSKMPLEVFIHGALCVSYSGGCLMSSMISLRSGNRGRCSQNCRKEYTIYKNNKPITEKGFYLSMKDLNTSSHLDKLLDINVDSLKIEGRMKNPEYVKTVVNEYRNIIDNYPHIVKTNLDSIFHRTYTKGFLFNEDRGNISNPLKSNNEGKYIGKIGKIKDNQTEIILISDLNINDRIRIEGNDNYYITIDNLTKNKNAAFINKALPVHTNDKVYIMVDSTINIEIDNSKKIPLYMYLNGSANNELELVVSYNDNYYTYKTESKLQKAINKPMDKNSFYNQLSKLNDTPFYLNYLEYNINDDVFIPIKDINELRRHMVKDLLTKKRIRRNPVINKANNPIIFDKHNLTLSCYVTNDIQYKACKDLGIDNIYYKNHSPYINSKYPEYDNMLVSNYGGLYKYQNKLITSDYTFNIINHKAVNFLHNHNVYLVTLSTEISSNELKELVDAYKNEYHGYPNLSMIVYGYERLMNMKYCPLKSLGECSKCQNSIYHLSDGIKKFPLIHQNCISNVLNSNPTNLIDHLKDISNYVNDIRLDFTIEDYNETINIINMFKNKLNNLDDKTNLFNSNTQTKGHYKRPIL